jgi:hypothetical protein
MFLGSRYVTGAIVLPVAYPVLRLYAGLSSISC